MSFVRAQEEMAEERTENQCVSVAPREAGHQDQSI